MKKRFIRKAISMVAVISIVTAVAKESYCGAASYSIKYYDAFRGVYFYQDKVQSRKVYYNIGNNKKTMYSLRHDKYSNYIDKYVSAIKSCNQHSVRFLIASGAAGFVSTAELASLLSSGSSIQSIIGGVVDVGLGLDAIYEYLAANDDYCDAIQSYNKLVKITGSTYK